MKKVITTSQFKKDAKSLNENHLSETKAVIDKLAASEILPSKYKDHKLVGGDYKDCRECHIKPDLLLIYRSSDSVLELARIGSHSKLFR